MSYKVRLSSVSLSLLILLSLSSCSNPALQSTEETIKQSGFKAPSKFETSVLFPDYMVDDYKSRNMSTKSFSIKRMRQVDAVRIVIKSESDGSKQEKIVYPSATQVSAIFEDVSVGKVKVYAEAWGAGGYQPSDANNLITSGEAYVSVSENKLSEAFIALEIPKEQIDSFIEKKYGKGSVKAVVALVEKEGVDEKEPSSTGKNNNDFNTMETLPPDFSNPGYYSPINPFDQFGKNWYECTRYAFGRAYEKKGVSLNFTKNSGRHGGKWFDIVTYFPRGLTPKPNSIVSWRYGEYGHVAFVEKVEGDKVTFSESNWADPTDGKYKGFKTLTVKQMENRGVYKLAGYVYLD